MSRTHKDRPFFVRMREKVEKGEYDHWHHHGLGSKKRVVSYQMDFKKKDAKEINEFRNFLIEDGISFEEEELEALYKFNMVNEDNWIREEIAPKRIRFKYEQEVETKRGYSSYCTDLEHYDPHTQTDTRDGKKASCLPFVITYCHCSFCSPPRKNNKTKRNASLNSIAKAYNNRIDYDELYEFDDLVLDIE